MLPDEIIVGVITGITTTTALKKKRNPSARGPLGNVKNRIVGGNPTRFIQESLLHFRFCCGLLFEFISTSGSPLPVILWAVHKAWIVTTMSATVRFQQRRVGFSPVTTEVELFTPCPN